MSGAPVTEATEVHADRDRAGRRSHEAGSRTGVPGGFGLLVAAIGLLAAAPTLASATHAGFLVDDWIFLQSAERSPWTWWMHAIDTRYRPVQAAMHGAMFGIIGDHPAVHLLVLAVLEIAVVALLARLLVRFLTPRTTLAVLVVWALLANRSSARFWTSAAPIPVAVLLLIGAALAATSLRPRPVLATALACLALLTYEGGVGLGLAIVITAWFERGTPLRRQWRTLAGPVAVYAATVAWNYATSPKSLYGYGPLPSAVDALTGAGIMPRALGALAGPAGYALMTAALLGVWLVPAARRMAAIGAVAAAVALAPLLVVGAFPAASGPFDRLNVFTMLGLAVVLGVGLDALVERAVVPGSIVVAAGVVAMVAAQADDIGDVNAARDQGAEIVAAFRALPAELAGRSLVFDPGYSHHGWYPFGYGSAKAAVERATGAPIDLDDPQRWRLDPAPGQVVVTVRDGVVVTERR